MTTLKRKLAAEFRVRQLLAEHDVPAPDEVEYGFACIRLIWHSSKTVLVVDLEPGGDGEEVAADDRALKG